MKRRVSISIVLGLTLTAIDWGTASNWQPNATLAVEVSTNTCNNPVGRLISVQGAVQLKRRGRSDYHSTAVGTELCLGDVVRAAKGARAIVQCSDPNQNPWTVPEGVPSGVANGCREPNKPRFRVPGPITPSRDRLGRSIPYIISPNSTLLLNDKPKLRWQPVPGATSYIVRVSGPKVTWETEVSTTEVVYPGEPPLQPVEQGYLLTVEADNGESPARATFGLLDENQAQGVRTAGERIASQNLPEDAKALALADLYVGQKLIAEALEVLEASVAKGSQIAAIYHTLGDLYGQMELLSQAEKHYLKAFELATTADNIEGQADAAARLGEVYAALGNLEEASRWQKEAQERYQALGVSLNP